MFENRAIQWLGASFRGKAAGARFERKRLLILDSVRRYTDDEADGCPAHFPRPTQVQVKDAVIIEVATEAMSIWVSSVKRRASRDLTTGRSDGMLLRRDFRAKQLAAQCPAKTRGFPSADSWSE